ncbi:unnamed protein product [Ceutorhynchus assimilis]|uniref:Uncharacterized protein n=1 Tax=Ceutorhynchus assimilis TaxID=467358 RepID=A0A9N9QSX3_9CUCU|nr:unnamed protein product [Ceutorhynchus assimilis]
MDPLILTSKKLPLDIFLSIMFISIYFFLICEIMALKRKVSTMASKKVLQKLLLYESMARLLKSKKLARDNKSKPLFSKPLLHKSKSDIGPRLSLSQGDNLEHFLATFPEKYLRTVKKCPKSIMSIYSLNDIQVENVSSDYIL